MVLGIPKRALVIGLVLLGAALIYVFGADQNSEGSGSGEGAAEEVECEHIVTADILNVREAPSEQADIVGKYQQDAAVEVEPDVRNGFRKLEDRRWVADEFLNVADDC